MGQEWDIQTQAEFYEWLDRCPVQYQRRMNLQGEPSYVFFNHKKHKQEEVDVQTLLDNARGRKGRNAGR
jgi:stress response protein SCP2